MGSDRDAMVVARNCIVTLGDCNAVDPETDLVLVAEPAAEQAV
jgi:hypothetical protein